MDFLEQIWLKYAKKLLNLQSGILLRRRLEWKLWYKKEEKLKILIPFQKLQENISNKLFQLLEDQLPVWIYKSFNNLGVNLIQALPTKVVVKEDSQSIQLSGLL